MRLGIFAKTYDRPDVASCLQAVADAGIPATQFNLSGAGLPTIPETRDPPIQACKEPRHLTREDVHQASVADGTDRSQSG